jgi:hypothetical protein
MQVFSFEVSDDAIAVTAGASKVTFRLPFPVQVVGLSAGLTVAQTSGSALTVDVNKNGVSILTTKLTFDNTDKTSRTATTPHAFNGGTLFDLDDELTIDVDQIGDGTAKGLKVTLLGYQAAVPLAVTDPGDPPPGPTYVGWDPANKGTGVDLTTGTHANSDAEAGSPAGWTSVRAALGRSTGKWYWEVEFIAATGAADQFLVGAALSTSPMTDGAALGFNFASATAGAGARSDNNVFTWTKAQTGAPGVTSAVNQVVHFAYDGDTGKLYIGVDGVWKFSASPAAGTNPWITGISGTVYPACSFHSTTNAKIRLRTLASQMAITIPSGYTAWAE